MREPSRVAFRWGAPIAVGAALIAGLLVIPVFGGTLTTTQLKRQINATEGYFGPTQVGHSRQLVAGLPLKPGDYVTTTHYQSLREPRDRLSCGLHGGTTVLPSTLTAGCVIIVVSTVIAVLSGMDVGRRILTNLVILAAAVVVTYTIGLLTKTLWGVTV